MDSENHEIDAAIGTFDHPRDELLDAITILRQLGLADDPNSLRGRLTAVLTHPGTVIRGVKRKVATRQAARRGVSG